MSLTITETPATTFTPCPAGTYPARCVLVADLGTQKTEYQGEVKHQHKALLGFEICDTETRRDDGTAHVLFKRFTASLHEKAALRKDLAAWRGRDFTPEELRGFSVGAIVGKPALVTVVHATKGDRTYANLAALSPLPRGFTCPEAASPLICFDLGKPNFDAFALLPDRVQEQIRESPEWRSLDKKPDLAAGGDLEDDIPF